MNKFAEYLKKITEGKSVCLLGFGREGRSSYKMIQKYCSPKSIAIADISPVSGDEISDDVQLICGEDYQKSLDDFDMVFKSPGIVLEKKPSELKCEITSQTQVFFSVYREQIIGITGTKGKSTVTSLIYHILHESGKDCRIAGNIGIPVFDIAEDIASETIIVCELSCHQLEYMTVSPAKAIFLNLFEEHLDHYGTLKNYYNAKKNIYLHQEPFDTLWINSQLDDSDAPSSVITVSNKLNSADVFIIKSKVYDSDDGEFEIPTNKINLIGTHNYYNIAVAWDVCRNIVSRPEFNKALITFKPLPHRLELVGEYKGINWYDDSISTACATAIEAVKCVPQINTILLGGMDRGIDYHPLVDFLNLTDINIVCMEASGKRIYDLIHSQQFAASERVYYAEHLDEAVKIASEVTKSGMSCVLSPASASYGIFKNFEERGDAFQKLVREL